MVASKFLKDLMKRLVGGNLRSCQDLSNYLDYRKSLASRNIVEWALNGIDYTEEDTSSPVNPTKKEDYIEDLTAIVASHDKDMVKRIGDYLKYKGRGIDVARLYVALVEADEIKSNLTETRFMTALKISFPEVKIVRTRQVHKNVNTIQNLLPHGKRDCTINLNHRQPNKLFRIVMPNIG